jgi:hypothetical protein
LRQRNFRAQVAEEKNKKSKYKKKNDKAKIKNVKLKK